MVVADASHPQYHEGTGARELGMNLVLKTLLQVQTNVNEESEREGIRRIVIAAIYNKNFVCS